MSRRPVHAKGSLPLPASPPNPSRPTRPTRPSRPRPSRSISGPRALVKAAQAWCLSWPAGFRGLALIGLVSGFALIAFNSFMTPYLRERGVSVVAIGAFHGMSGAVSAVGSALAGALSDRYGRRTVLAVGRGFRFAAWSVVLIFPQEAALVAVAALIGLGMAGGSAHMTMVGEASPKGRRASGYAVIGAIDGVMAMIVPVAIGLLADAFGLRAALSLALVPGLAGLLLITRLQETAVAPEAGSPPARQAGAPASPPRASWLDGARFLVSPAGRGAALMGLVWLVTGFEMGLLGPVMPLYVQDRFGVNYAGLGLVATISSLGMVLGMLVGGRMADRVGNSRLMMVCLSLTAGVYLAVPQAGTAAVHAALMMLVSFCGCLAAPCWGAVSANVAPRVVRGGVGGLFSSTRSLGMALGGLLSGFAYRRAITLPLYIVVASELCMCVLVALGSRREWAGFGKGLVHDDD